MLTVRKEQNAFSRCPAHLEVYIHGGCLASLPPACGGGGIPQTSAQQQASGAANSGCKYRGRASPERMLFSQSRIQNAATKRTI